MVLVVVGSAAARGGWTPDPLAPDGAEQSRPHETSADDPDDVVPAPMLSSLVSEADADEPLPLLHLPAGAGLAEQLAAVASATRSAGHDACTVVTDATLGAAVLRAVRFARQAVRGILLNTVVLDASPLRLSVACAAFATLTHSVTVPVGMRPVVLHHMIQHTWSVQLTSSVARLCEPRPTLLQRFVPRRRNPYVVGDRPGTGIHRLGSEGRLPAEVLPEAWRKDTVVTVARSSRAAGVDQVLEWLAPTTVVEATPDASWWRRWTSSAGSELVVRSADVLAEAAVALDAVSESWTCSWCGTRLYSLSSCPQCRADFRPTERRRPGERATGRPRPRHRHAVPVP